MGDLERLAELAVIALGLVVGGAVLVAPGLPLEARGAALAAVAATFLLVARVSRPRDR